MSINRRNLAVADALAKTSNGREILASVKAVQAEADARLAQIRELCQDTFIHHNSSTLNLGWAYKKAETKARELAQEGGRAFEDAMTVLKYTWVDGPESFNRTLKVLGIE